MPEEQGFAARILKNLSRHGDNRTRLYRAELRLKASRWRDSVADEGPAEVEDQLETIASQGACT